MTKMQKSGKHATQLAHSGRDPAGFHGFVNAPLYRGSTVLYPSYDSLLADDQDYSYGRLGTPTVRALQDALAEMEGGHASLLTPSGLSAITTAIVSFVSSGDHILVSDSVYRPTRRFCDTVLSRLGVTTTYYDPLIGAEISELLTERTKLVFTESPGSQTFEIQDIPAIATAAHAVGAEVMMDNTWATPLYFKPFQHGVDVVVHAATKYLVGHADAMLGVITMSESATAPVVKTHDILGLCPGPEDVYLTLRGLRTLDVRLQRHEETGLALAAWLAERPEVSKVIHPARTDHPGHALWKRDFTGASGLFAIVLKPVPRPALAAMLDGLSLFGMGYSWGGYESLILPFDPRGYRSATVWDAEGPSLRLHAGLEDIEDLKADLEAGFRRLSDTR